MEHMGNLSSLFPPRATAVQVQPQSLLFWCCYSTKPVPAAAAAAGNTQPGLGVRHLHVPDSLNSPKQGLLRLILHQQLKVDLD